MTNATTRPRQGRRESVGGPSVGGNGKVRKNSVANANVGGAAGNIAQGRPRANTISHIDLSHLGIFDGANPNASRMNALGLSLGHQMNMGGLPGPGNYDYRGMSTAMGHHGNLHGLPKLDTHVNNLDMTNSLRTAPPQANFGGFDIDQLFTPHTTINPAALHFGGAGSIPSSNIPFGFDPSTNQQVPVEDDFGWMRNWNMQMSNGNDNEQAIDESSPSRISSGDSPGDYSESMSNSQVAMLNPQNTFGWQQQQQQQPNNDTKLVRPMSNGTFQLDALGNGLPNLDVPNGTVSPSTLHEPTASNEMYYQQALLHQNGIQQPHQTQPDMMTAQGAAVFSHPLSNFGSNSPSVSSSSMTGSARQSSVTSMSTDSITDATRQSLLNSLSQPSVFGGHGHRKYSQPNVSSPLSPGTNRGSMPNQGPSLPSTADIRRYIDAFMQFAHPHLPITHIATLSFDVIETTTGPRGTPPMTGTGRDGSNGGARCLILGMAAIGALYEYDHPASKDLFEAAKKMIQLYLEERRKADISAVTNGSKEGSETPLWLVQAMLLTVIYGHHCGDRLAADIASNHIAALVSLARAANLAHAPNSPSSPESEEKDEHKHEDVEMGEGNMASGSNKHTTDLHTRWIEWKTGEERKRCLFAIFVLSSLLTTAYNQTPTIMNSEILLDLPCDEELYSAESAEEWQHRGGLAAAEASSISFASALSTLLTANQRQGNKFTPSAYNSSSASGVSQADAEELRPSTFGCLVLINALHNYIWETRSRHRGREWTTQETESMVAHIEPALNAWQAAWKANEHHKLERPNPFGLGPLSADSIPLLDVAFVRLYVNLGRTAEAFWRRDFDQMAEELASGAETTAFMDSKERRNSAGEETYGSPMQKNGVTQRRLSQLPGAEPASSRRERHLRKAAFYAADSLTIACSYSLTYADPIAHELPIQSAICFFDSVQVLAEWCTTVQERAGRFLGVLGRDPIDYSQVPAIMLLESDDVELLRKIERICVHLEEKRQQQENLLSMDMNTFNSASAAMNLMANGVDLSSCGLASKVLRVVAMMLEKAVIWPSK